MKISIQQKDVKSIFRKCGTCSQTFGHILNREFGNANEDFEKALDPLAGGISNQGHQCGMLWGSALAVGAEAFDRYKNTDTATAIAMSSTQMVVDSFVSKTNSINCKEIIGTDLSSFLGMVKYMVKTMAKGINNSQCFNMAEEWALDAIHAASEGLSKEKSEQQQKTLSCSSELVKKMGGSEQEALLVAGFAGGLGLSGGACGALAAAIWYSNLKWCRDNPEKRPPYFNNPYAKNLLRVFKEETNSSMLCKEICGKRFNTINEHTSYINKGGCSELVDALSKVEIE